MKTKLTELHILKTEELVPAEFARELEKGLIRANREILRLRKLLQHPNPTPNPKRAL